MGKLARSQVIARAQRVAEGLEPYVHSGGKVIPRGKTSQSAGVAVVSTHPGSKSRFGKLLPVVTDSQGKRHVVWPAKARRGRQAAATGHLERFQRYQAQNGSQKLRNVRPLSKAEKLAGVQSEVTSLTPAQLRRSTHKLNHGLAKSR